MYQVFMGYVPLPVTPGRIETVVNGRNETCELIDGSEINIMKLPGLKEISFEFMLPHQSYPFASSAGSLLNSFTDALGSVVGGLLKGAQSSGILSYLEYLKTNRESFQFIVIRTGEGVGLLSGYDVNLKVALEDYTIIEDADNGMDIMVRVKLKEYKTYGTKTVNADKTVTKTRAKA